jgi:hypothetical protein
MGPQVSLFNSRMQRILRPRRGRRTADPQGRSTACDALKNVARAS